MQIGDTVYPDGCTGEYQKKNPLTIKYMEQHTATAELDGEKVKLSWTSASENGWSWFPSSALTMELSMEKVAI